MKIVMPINIDTWWVSQNERILLHTRSYLDQYHPNTISILRCFYLYRKVLALHTNLWHQNNVKFHYILPRSNRKMWFKLNTRKYPESFQMVVSKLPCSTTSSTSRVPVHICEYLRAITWCRILINVIPWEAHVYPDSSSYTGSYTKYNI